MKRDTGLVMRPLPSKAVPRPGSRARIWNQMHSLGTRILHTWGVMLTPIGRCKASRTGHFADHSLGGWWEETLAKTGPSIGWLVAHQGALPWGELSDLAGQLTGVSWRRQRRLMRDRPVSLQSCLASLRQPQQLSFLRADLRAPPSPTPCVGHRTQSRGTLTQVTVSAPIVVLHLSIEMSTSVVLFWGDSLF